MYEVNEYLTARHAPPLQRMLLLSAPESIPGMNSTPGILCPSDNKAPCGVWQVKERNQDPTSLARASQVGQLAFIGDRRLVVSSQRTADNKRGTTHHRFLPYLNELQQQLRGRRVH